MRISDAGLKRAARGSLKYRTQKSRQKSPSGHHRTTLSGYIIATKAPIDNQKKTVKQQYILHMSSQYGELPPLAAEIGLPVWGTPVKFNWFRVLAALLHGRQVVHAPQPNFVALNALNTGSHLCSAERPSRWARHWPTFLVDYVWTLLQIYVNLYR